MKDVGGLRSHQRYAPDPRADQQLSTYRQSVGTLGRFLGHMHGTHVWAAVVASRFQTQVGHGHCCSAEWHSPWIVMRCCCCHSTAFAAVLLAAVLLAAVLLAAVLLLLLSMHVPHSIACQPRIEAGALNTFICAERSGGAAVVHIHIVLIEPVWMNKSGLLGVRCRKRS